MTSGHHIITLPGRTTMRGPSDKKRHAGDLGNIDADETGIATFEILDDQIPLCGKNSIIGRSVVVGIYLAINCLLATVERSNKGPSEIGMTSLQRHLLHHHANTLVY